MNYLVSISDKDIFPDVELSVMPPDHTRISARIVAFDSEGKLALVGSRYFLIPGGGVEEGEDLVGAAERECLEEIGCNVKIGEKFCVTEEFRNKKGRQHTSSGRQETHFFTAHIIGEKGIPQSTQEDEQGMKVKWYTLDDAIKLLLDEIKTISFESYHACFNVRTHLAALRYLQQLRIK